MTNRVQRVKTLSDLFNAAFDKKTNCFLYRRPLHVYFNTLCTLLRKELNLGEDQYHTIEGYKNVRACIKSIEHPVAAQIMRDIKAFRKNGWKGFELRLISSQGHPKTVLSDDLHQWHVDFECKGDERILVCYEGDAVQWIENEDALAHSYDPTFFHARNGALIHQAKTGDILKFRTQPETNSQADLAPAFVHRAPPAGKPRLVLTCDRV